MEPWQNDGIRNAITASRDLLTVELQQALSERSIDLESTLKLGSRIASHDVLLDTLSKIRIQSQRRKP